MKTLSLPTQNYNRTSPLQFRRKISSTGGRTLENFRDRRALPGSILQNLTKKLAEEIQALLSKKMYTLNIPFMRQVDRRFKIYRARNVLDILEAMILEVVISLREVQIHISSVSLYLNSIVIRLNSRAEVTHTKI